MDKDYVNCFPLNLGMSQTDIQSNNLSQFTRHNISRLSPTPLKTHEGLTCITQTLQGHKYTISYV